MIKQRKESTVQEAWEAIEQYNSVRSVLPDHVNDLFLIGLIKVVIDLFDKDLHDEERKEIGALIDKIVVLVDGVPKRYDLIKFTVESDDDVIDIEPNTLITFKDGRTGVFIGVSGGGLDGVFGYISIDGSLFMVQADEIRGATAFKNDKK